MLEWWRIFRAWLRRDALEAELREEIQTHLAMKAEASGDAHAVQRQFGNTTRHIEDARDAWTLPRIDDWFRDFRYAARMMRRRPAFTATVVLTLALGIGSSSTIFSLIDTVLVRGLPYPNSDRIVSVQEARITDVANSRTPVSPGRLEDWRRMSSSFDAIAGSYTDTLTDTTTGNPERVPTAFVSPDFFNVLATPPALGRVFNESEQRFGGPAAVVISDSFWRKRFDQDPLATGRVVTLGGQSYTIVGVMPPSFRYPEAVTEVWLAKQAQPSLMRIREARFYNCIALLRPGVAITQARNDLAAVQLELGRTYPKTDAGLTVAMMPLKERMVGNVKLALWLLLGSVSLLLLIACSNVACLMLAQLNGRATEIATRSSLGAGRTAIVRQLFIEGLSCAFVGGALGAAGAFASVGLLKSQLADLPRISELTIDARTLAMIAGISLFTAVFFSLAPVLQTFRRDTAVALIRSGRGVIGGRQFLPRVLVSVQLALATALLIGAGLFLQSMVRLQEVDLGFRAANVLTLRVGASFSERPAEAIQRHHRTMNAIAAVPGVASVAMSTGLPGVNRAWPREFDIAGEPSPDGGQRFGEWRIVTSEYFQTLGIPVLSGTTCRMNMDVDAPFEAVVNRSFVNRYFPGRDPIGHIVKNGLAGGEPFRIIGVAADTREDGAAMEPSPLIYACGYLRYWPDSNFLIRTHGAPANAVQAIRAALRSVDPSRTVYSVRPLEEALSASLAQNRFRTLLVTIFSAMALTLAAIGLYGVMAYMITQRTREIGIRIALGARPHQIIVEILRTGGALALSGSLVGVLLAAAGSGLIGALLYGIQASDAATYLGAIVVLLAVSLIACLIPGRRATSIDPTAALR